MNLFLTVGTQLPFNRLTRAIDAWIAEVPGPKAQIFAQIGPIGTQDYRPRNFEWTEFLEPQAFGERFDAATHIISHAGMGTIISAMVAGKPITVLPRREALGEQRNDHQIATVRNFRDRPGVCVAEHETELPQAIDRMLTQAWPASPTSVHDTADPELIAAIRTEIMA